MCLSAGVSVVFTIARTVGSRSCKVVIMLIFFSSLKGREKIGRSGGGQYLLSVSFAVECRKHTYGGHGEIATTHMLAQKFCSEFSFNDYVFIFRH